MGKRGKFIQECSVKTEVKGRLRRPRCRWKDNITTDLKDIGCEGMDWIQLTQLRFSGKLFFDTVMNL
jgi:hypothetical protein